MTELHRAESPTVRPARAEDFAVWDRLYEAYASFYRSQQSAEQRQRVWGWITDPAHEVNALVVVGADDVPFGFAHYRPFARPLAAATGCYLDDLFVDPAHRGQGAVDALLAELRRLSQENGWSVVRWITADNNYRARSVYDRVAGRTPWITYDMAPE